MRSICLCIAAVVSTVTIGIAQERGPQPQPPPQPRATQATAGMSGGTSDFVGKVLEAGAVEVAAARMATTNASSPAVKAFATRMIADHGTSGDELRALAKDRSIRMPADADTSAAVSKATAKLSNLSGAEFDRAYMDMQVAAHQDAVTRFEHQSKQGTDTAIRAWAQKMLPTLREHQKMAETTSDALGPRARP